MIGFGAGGDCYLGTKTCVPVLRKRAGTLLKDLSWNEQIIRWERLTSYSQEKSPACPPGKAG